MWYLLATSLAALSLNKSLAYLMLGLTAFLGWKQGVLDAPALLVIASIVIGWSVVEWLRNNNNKYTYLVEGLCVAIAVALFLHAIPGFHNPKVLDAVVVGPQSIPFTMYFNMDKAVVPFILMTCMPTLFVAKPLYNAGKAGWGILVLAIPVLFCKAAGPFHVLERQLPAAALQQYLLETKPPQGSVKEWFTRSEWPILQELSRGKTLRQIALIQNHPYSRIIYRLGCILTKLGLNHRQELLHLLNNLSDCTF